METNHLKKGLGDFPGGPVVKNPTSNAGDANSIPDRGTKIPHAAGQLSPHTTTTEHMRSGACTLQRKIPHAATKTPRAATKARCSQKLKKKNFNK